MSDDKTYSPTEVAQLVKEKLQECLQKSEITSDMMKSSNSSHEIDAGEEPRNDDAECPKSLGGSGANSSESSSESSSDGEYSESAEYSEDESFEDEALSDYEDEDEDEDEDSESEEEEEGEEEEYEFKKSEDCGYSITYKSMKKSSRELKKMGGPSIKPPEPPQPDSGATAKPASSLKDFGSKLGTPPKKGDKLKFDTGGFKFGKDEDGDKKEGNISTKRFEPGEEKMSNEGQSEVKRTSQNPKQTGKSHQDYNKEFGNWRKRMTKETGDDGYLKGKHDHKYEAENKKSESDMIKEEIQSEMGKCGDMADALKKKKVKK